MRRIPTDRELLTAIWDRYYDDFVAYDPATPRGQGPRSTLIYVPIDIDLIGGDLGMHREIVFGRLYYHLDKIHGHREADGTNSSFFAMRVGGDRHAIHFPRLAAVLAELQDKERRWRLATGMAFVSLIISVTSFVISVAT